MALAYLAFSCAFILHSQMNVAGATNNIFSYEFVNMNFYNISFFGLDMNLLRLTNTPSTSRPMQLLSASVAPNDDDETKLRTPELIRKHGYPAEVHNVTTQDGYILEVHRIPRPKARPVILTHGLLDSSATWVLMGPKQGLAYLLYDQGYDVWLMNVRGNTYSRRHKNYTTSDTEFWKFTFHEMGIYDLTATIDYVLDKSSHVQLHYIGHSQGTVAFWIMASERPAYMAKILLMQALAPVAYIGHSKSPVMRFIGAFQEPLNILFNLIGAHEFLPNNEFIQLFRFACDQMRVTEEICTNIIFLATGFDATELNETMIPVILGHVPAGASTKQMQHYGQLRHSKQFRQFDYGWLNNLQHYGSHVPPSYKLSNVNCKVALYYSKNDWLADPLDVEHLHKDLPNVIKTKLVSYEHFNHVDFVWGIDAKSLLYDDVIELMWQVELGIFS